jgi:hypothetical protein
MAVSFGGEFPRNVSILGGRRESSVKRKGFEASILRL